MHVALCLVFHNYLVQHAIQVYGKCSGVLRGPSVEQYGQVHVVQAGVGALG